MNGLNGPQGGGVSKDGDGFRQNPNLPFDEGKKALWATKTTAMFLNEGEFKLFKEHSGLHVLGVTGFSGQWSEQKIKDDEVVRDDAKAATAAIANFLSELKAIHGDKLVVSSGATMEGVPKIIYEECEKLGITAMGVACAKAFDYALGKMKYLIIQGDAWGEESATFLGTSDELLMVGGGGQAKREAIAAASEGKPVTIFQGYKGAADQLTSVDLPDARFVARH